MIGCDDDMIGDPTSQTNVLVLTVDNNLYSHLKVGYCINVSKHGEMCTQETASAVCNSHLRFRAVHRGWEAHHIRLRRRAAQWASLSHFQESSNSQSCRSRKTLHPSTLSPPLAEKFRSNRTNRPG